MYTAEAEDALLAGSPDFVVDAIDNIDTKVGQTCRSEACACGACHRLQAHSPTPSQYRPLLLGQRLAAMATLTAGAAGALPERQAKRAMARSALGRGDQGTVANLRRPEQGRRLPRGTGVDPTGPEPAAGCRAGGAAGGVRGAGAAGAVLRGGGRQGGPHPPAAVRRR